MRLRPLTLSLCLAAALLAASSPSQALVIGGYNVTVDGNLSDIGVTPGSHWAPYAGVFAASENDVPDGSGLGVYVGPGYGGQLYDAEGLYCLRDAQNTYVAVVSGQKLSNPAQYVAPGDLAISTNGGVSWNLAVELTGKTYTINSSGYTTGVSTDKVQGGIYHDPAWLHGLNNWSGSSDPTQLSGGTLSGLAQLAYGETGSHAVWELVLPTSETGDGPLELHWTMACGNDAVDLNVPAAPVPEPATMLLIGGGLLGLVRAHRRRR